MFATIRRHQKWLWFVIIGIVILSFVWFMGPTPMRKSGGGGRMAGGGTYGRIDGHKITHDDYLQAIDDIRLASALRGRERPDEDTILQQLPERLFLIQKVREFGIRAGDEAAADWIVTAFSDRQRGGGFNKEQYDQFVRQKLRQLGVTEASFNEFARHEASIGHLASVVGLSGLVMPPREAESLFRRENEQVTVEIALLSVSNHLAEVLVSPETLATYYTNNAAKFRVPDMVEVSYVRFPNSNYLAEASEHFAKLTNVDLQLDRIYRERGADAFLGTDGKPLTPEAAKEKMKLDYKNELSGSFALKAAAEFAEKLYTALEAQPGATDLLEKVAATNNLISGVTRPFTEFGRPAGLLVGADFAQTAFTLSTNQVMATEAIVGQDAAYIIAFKNRTESHLPPLAEREQSVAADYRRTEALRLAQEKAKAFRVTLTNALAQGQVFDAVCSANGATAVHPPAFSRSTQNLPGISEFMDVGELKSIALDLPANTFSGVQSTVGGAVIVHVTGRQPVSPERLKAELPAFQQSLRSEHRQEALMEWFRQAKGAAQIDLPVLQQSRRRGQSQN